MGLQVLVVTVIVDWDGLTGCSGDCNGGLGWAYRL